MYNQGPSCTNLSYFKAHTNHTLAFIVKLCSSVDITYRLYHIDLKYTIKLVLIPVYAKTFLIPQDNLTDNFYVLPVMNNLYLSHY